jgi:hypothetical protein
VERLDSPEPCPTSQAQGGVTPDQGRNALTAPGSVPAFNLAAPPPNRLDVQAEGIPFDVGDPPRKGDHGPAPSGRDPSAWDVVTGQVWGG